MNQPSDINEFYYFDENGLMVFTESYHLQRGYCCKCGCRHCPYGFGREEGKDASNTFLKTTKPE